MGLHAGQHTLMGLSRREVLRTTVLAFFWPLGKPKRLKDVYSDLYKRKG